MYSIQNLIETALTGVVKNAATVRKISGWAMQYAAVYPAMYEDVMEAMKGMSMMPAMKSMFTKADTEGMERIALKTVHINKCPALSPIKTLRPEDQDRLGIDLRLCEENKGHGKKEPGKGGNYG